jgi:putative transposon-encoded protein
MTTKKENLDMFQIHGYEVIEKEVTNAGTSGKIYLPVNWIGKKVKVVRIE